MRTKLLLINLLISILITTNIVAQEGRFSGKFIDTRTGNGIMGVVITDDYGRILTMSGINGNTSATTRVGRHTLHARYAGYSSISFDVTINLGAVFDFGVISLTRDISWPDIELINYITERVAYDNIDYQTVQSVSSQSANTFYKRATTTFSSMLFRIRGYENRYTGANINGYIINDREDGNIYWDNISGLTDVLLNNSESYSSEPIGVINESVGGAINIETKASEYKKGMTVGYTRASETYRNRVAVTYSTGLLENDWAFSGSLVHRSSRSGYVEGTPYSSNSLLFAVEKIINSAQSLNLTFIDVYNKKGIAGDATLATYEKNGDNYFNPFWGYKSGKGRNEKVKSSHSPLIMLTHYWRQSEKLDIQTNIGYSRSGSEYSSLDFDESLFRGANRVDWDSIYFVNNNNYQTINNIGGNEGYNVSGNRSNNVVMERSSIATQYQLNTRIDWNPGKEINIQGGLVATTYKGRHFNRVVDLLGGDYWIASAYNQLGPTSKLVGNGDITETNYTLSSGDISIWSTGRYTKNNFDIYLSFGVKGTSMNRFGNKYYSSLPEEDKRGLTYFTWSAKLGGSYRIGEHQGLSINSLLMTNSPLISNVYIEPRYNDVVVPNLSIEHLGSVDVNYSIQTEHIKALLSAYYTKFINTSEVMDLYIFDIEPSLSYSLTGIDKQNYGIEFSLEADLLKRLYITGVASLGRYIYSSDPAITIVGYSLYKENIVDFSSQHQVGTPQTAISLGLKYKSANHWQVELTGSYYGRLYYDMNPLIRLLKADETVSEETAEEIYVVQADVDKPVQSKAASGFLVDLSGAKIWEINQNYFLVLSGHISNLLNNTDLTIGGHESRGLSTKHFTNLQTSFNYHPGMVYYLSIAFKF